MVTDPALSLKFLNQCLINQISGCRESPYVDSFEGVVLDEFKIYYLSSNREIILKELIKNFPKQEGVA